MSLFTWLRNRTSLRSRQWDGFQIRPTAPRFRPQLEALEDRWLPSTLTVTNNLDGGAGSLRAEIAAAKSKDTIVFATSLNGQTISLTSGALDINKNLTIQGPGAGELTVSGGGNPYSVFYLGGLNTNGKIKVSLSGLTISNGNALSNGSNGGGIHIFYNANLTISGCTLSGNSASLGGAIYNDHGTVTVSACTLSGNSAGDKGGAIFNAGKMTITDSTLSGNRTLVSDPAFPEDEGGAIYNDQGATLTVSGCSLSDNFAHDHGGAIYN